MMSNWPATPEAWCEYLRALDAKYDTSVRSPLHHDHRCPLHAVRPDAGQEGSMPFGPGGVFVDYLD